MSWGAVVVRQAAVNRAERVMRLGAAALAAAAFGAGLRTGLTAPSTVPEPSTYMAWVWPDAVAAWGAFSAALGRQLVLGPAVAWIAGLTVLGSPLALGAVVLRAYLAGVVVLSALARWGWEGAPVVLLSLLPSHLLGIQATVHGAVGAMQWTVAFGKAVSGPGSVEVRDEFRRYVLVGLGTWLLAASAAGAEVLGVTAARVLLSLARRGI